MTSALEEGIDWRPKILFGTDWHTTYVNASPRAYPTRYFKFFDTYLSGGSAAVIAAFRGRNALRFLGLYSSAPNSSGRKRLAAFYKNNNLFTLLGDDKPVWW